MTKAFYNARIFTGSEFLENKTVIVKSETIADIIDSNDVGESIDKSDCKGNYLVPAFIDLQLYGGNGLLFADHPSIESITATFNYSLQGGATNILPTIGTHTFDKIIEAVRAVKEYWHQGLPGVEGLHVEGPFINPIKRGAHILEYIKKPSMENVRQLMDEGEGVIRMMTIAPEFCTDEVLQFLEKNGVIISAGHSNATYEEASSAFNKNIHAATHLFNAMSAFQHRAPGLAGAILDANDAMCSIVADGYHVDFAAIRVAKKIMGDRLFLITDAVTGNNSGAYQHRLEGDKYVMPDGTLSGSALTMLKAVQNCVNHIGISLDESLRMASLYPAKVLGLDYQLGRIQKDYNAELVCLDKNLSLLGVHSSSANVSF